MKAQEIVDKVIDFYSDPNHRPGCNFDRRPTYYATENARCAIGCLLDPKDALTLQELSEHFDFYRVSAWLTAKFMTSVGIDDVSLATAQGFLNPIVPEDLEKPIEFLNLLQCVHDVSLCKYDGASTLSFLNAFKAALKKELLDEGIELEIK